MTSSGTATTQDGTSLLTEANPFRYASYFYDEETDIYYLNARYYDAEIGRFTTRDVIPHVNLYVYGENNPVNFVDPSGYLANTLGPMIDGMYLTPEAARESVKVNIPDATEKLNNLMKENEKKAEKFVKVSSAPLKIVAFYYWVFGLSCGKRDKKICIVSIENKLGIIIITHW